MMEALAQEAADHWGGSVLRLIRNRENAVFEIRLPGRQPAALRLHRPGYQPDAAIRSELWWCATLAAKGVNVPAALPAKDGTLLVTLSTGRAASCELSSGCPFGADQGGWSYHTSSLQERPE